MMISLEDNLHNRSYAVWSQLAAEPLALTGDGRSRARRTDEPAPIDSKQAGDDRHACAAARTAAPYVA